MAVQKETWVDYIIGNLFKSNEWMELCFNESENVLNGSVVHIPQAGAKPVTVKNNTSWPMTAVQRTDNDIIYPLDAYSTTPTHIANAEAAELSYDKMTSVIGEHIESLRETVADDLLYKWVQTYSGDTLPAVLRTTGASLAAHLPGATGNRLKFVKENLQAARTRMNKQNVSREGRYALFPSDLMEQLMTDDDLKKRDSSMELDMRGGVVTRLYGFDLIERSGTLTYDNAGTPAVKAIGAATAVTDNDSVVCWQRNAVARALGTVDFFEDVQNPLYQGDIYSALVRMGGRRRRKTAEGIIVIVQAAA